MEIAIPKRKEEFVALVEHFRSSENLSLPKAVYRVVDLLLEKHREQPRFQMACQAGCAHCCYQLVLPTYAEWLAIEEYLQGNQPLFDTLRERLRQSISAWNSYVQQSGGRVNVEKLPGDWAGQPCPFLDPQSQKCQVYPVRPLTCRIFGSRTKCQSILDTPTDMPAYPWAVWAFEILFRYRGFEQVHAIQAWADATLGKKL